MNKGVQDCNSSPHVLATETLALLLEAERVTDRICWEEAKIVELVVAAVPETATAILQTKLIQLSFR